MLISIATFQKHPYLGKVSIFFSNINFEGGGTKGPMGANIFTQFLTDNFTLFLTDNFDINISLRELTLHTIEIHIFRPLDLTHMNILS